MYSVSVARHILCNDLEEASSGESVRVQLSREEITVMTKIHCLLRNANMTLKYFTHKVVILT